MIPANEREKGGGGKTQGVADYRCLLRGFEISWIIKTTKFFGSFLSRGKARMKKEKKECFPSCNGRVHEMPSERHRDPPQSWNTGGKKQR